MNLTYYNNVTDERYIVKKITQISLAEHANPVEIKMIDNSSIVKPTFKMRDVDVYMTANYCYVDDLHRYYYIDNITVSKGFAFLECTEDVLMTYKESLHDLEVLVDRNQWDYNLYQVDDKLTLNNYMSQKRIEFPDGFNSETQQFLLCVIGNTTDEGE